MNLCVVELLRKGPIGGNNCHILSGFATRGNHSDPEGIGCWVVVGSPDRVVVVLGDDVPLLVGGGDWGV